MAAVIGAFGSLHNLTLDRLELRRMSGVLSLRCAYADVPEMKAMSLLNSTRRRESEMVPLV